MVGGGEAGERGKGNGGKTGCERIWPAAVNVVSVELEALVPRGQKRG